MMNDAFTLSVPLLKTMLGNLAAILKKAEQDAAARKIEPRVFLEARLAPDMFPLTRQVQIASDQAKGVARLAGVTPPAFADDEASFEALFARIAKTITFLDSLTPSQFEGAQDREIRFEIGPYKFQFMGLDYLTQWTLPNFFFHVTTAYNILRHNGVEIGKRDFLGEMTR
jgi:hypothetical protein